MSTLADQIQDVFTRRVLGNKLVTAPVTYWNGHYTTERVYFVSNTFRYVEAVIVSIDSWRLGPFDSAKRRGYTVEITVEDHPFFHLGEQIDRVSPNQLQPRHYGRNATDDVVIARVDAAKLAKVR